MSDRFRREGDPEDGAVSATTTTTHEPPTEATRVHETDREPVRERIAGAPLDRETMRTVRARQREEFGGINWGASFFGWLSAMGLAAILVAILSAAGTALAISNDADNGDAGTIGIAGGIAVLVVLAVAYFAGGYVAGRMSRFDGARQGLGVWIIALVVAVVLAVAGVLLGGEYNVLSKLDLPRIPVDEGDVTTGGIIALAIGLVVTILAAMAGGKAGERYHRRVDRAVVAD